MAVDKEEEVTAGWLAAGKKAESFDAPLWGPRAEPVPVAAAAAPLLLQGAAGAAGAASSSGLPVTGSRPRHSSMHARQKMWPQATSTGLSGGAAKQMGHSLAATSPDAMPRATSA